MHACTQHAMILIHTICDNDKDYIEMIMEGVN